MWQSLSHIPSIFFHIFQEILSTSSYMNEPTMEGETSMVEFKSSSTFRCVEASKFSPFCSTLGSDSVLGKLEHHHRHSRPGSDTG